MLTGHYRGPIDFHDQLLKAAETGLQRIRTCSENLQFTSNSRASADLPTDAPLCQELRKGIKRHKEQFIQAMEDDLNTADALAAIFELVRLANTAAADQTVASAVLREAREQIIELCDVLGLVVEDQTKPAIPEAVLRLVEERTAAKAERNFTKADELRDRIAELGYKVEDTPEGPKVLPQ